MGVRLVFGRGAEVLRPLLAQGLQIVAIAVVVSIIRLEDVVQFTLGVHLHTPLSRLPRHLRTLGVPAADGLLGVEGTLLHPGEDLIRAHEGAGLDAVHFVAVADVGVGLLREGHAVVVHGDD